MSRSQRPATEGGTRRSPAAAAALAAMWLAAAPAMAAPRFAEAPHDYWTRPLNDPFTLFLREEAGKLPAGGDRTFLTGMLRALKVPESSQLLVFSATSLQRLVGPRRPRAIYFNEEISVGWVPDGRIEVLSVDPEAGPVFFIMSFPRSGQSLMPERQERCLNCHAALKTGQLPGFVFESVIINDQGGTLVSHREDEIGHAVAIADRFGGWHLTGGLIAATPHANRIGQLLDGRLETRDNPPGQRFDLARYPRPTSDGLVHLIHEHQAGFINRLTTSAYRARELESLPEGSFGPAEARELGSLAHDLIRYALFADEAPLPAGGLAGDPGFVEDFTQAGRLATGAGSLREFDLKSRLFKFRCSYMIYTRQWAAMPPRLKKAVYAQLATALSPAQTGEWGYLPPAEKRAIASILRETLTDLPAGWSAQ